MPLEYGSELLGRDPECASVGIRSAVKRVINNITTIYVTAAALGPFFLFPTRFFCCRRMAAMAPEEREAAMAQWADRREKLARSTWHEDPYLQPEKLSAGPPTAVRAKKSKQQLEEEAELAREKQEKHAESMSLKADKNDNTWMFGQENQIVFKSHKFVVSRRSLAPPPCGLCTAMQRCQPTICLLFSSLS